MPNVDRVADGGAMKTGELVTNGGALPSAVRSSEGGAVKMVDTSDDCLVGRKPSQSEASASICTRRSNILDGCAFGCRVRTHSTEGF